MKRRGLSTLLVTFALPLAGCGARELALDIDFTPYALAEEASALELYVVDRCADVTAGELPASSRASVSFRRSEPPRAVPGVLPERFGVAVIARDASCGIVGAGCTDATRDRDSVRVEVVSARGDACTGAATCVDGLCEASDVDAAVDAATERTDAGPGDAAAPPDAFAPESVCDCTDDDADGRIDEGCDTRVLWQSPIDAAGTQGLRGAMRGGDDRVYLNGWMDTLGMEISLCGTSGLRGTGTGGASYTIGLDATTGACASLFERPESGTIPRSPFATPHRGRTGAWLFAGARLLELSGTSERARLDLNDAALFDVGDVHPRPGSAEDLLVHWWRATAAQPTLLGTAVGTASGDPLVLVTGAPPSVAQSTALPREALVGWLDASRVFVVAPSAPAVGFPCDNAAEHPSTGGLRVELRDVGSLARCSGAFGVALDPSGVRERAAVASGTHVWTLLLFPDRYELVGLDTTTGATDVSTILAPLREGEGDTLTHLAPASGGDVIVGGTLADGPSGARVFRGLVARAGLDAGVVVERTRRTLADGVVGVSTSPDGAIAYATAYVSDRAPLCDGDTFVADGGGLLVHAIDLEP
jgi:hypothetical protein